MVARTGLFVAPLPGSTPQGTSPTDGRLVLGALFGTGGGCIAGGAFTSSATQMQITVASSVWRIADPTNSAAVSLSPGDPYTFGFSAGPASGSRKDVLWVKQNNYENGDADSRVTYGIQVGVAASPGTEPAITTAGALKIGVLTVPAGATNAAACTLVAPFSGQTSAVPFIAVDTTAHLPAAGAAYGQLAYVAAAVFGGQTIPCTFRWNGTAWDPWDTNWITFNPSGAGAAYTTPAASTRLTGGRAQLEFNSVVNNQGNAQVTLAGLPFPFRSGAQPTGNAFLISSGSTLYPLTMVGQNSTTFAFNYSSGTGGGTQPTNGQSAPVAWLNGTLFVSASWSSS